MCTIANCERRFSVAIENVLSWFQHAAERDRVANSLTLVTGHVKSKSWGVAAIANSSRASSASLTFSFGGTMGTSLSVSHSWRGYSPWMYNTGPQTPSRNLNQCLFIRGFRIMKRGKLSPLRFVSEIKVRDLVDGRLTYPRVGRAGYSSIDQAASTVQESQVAGPSIIPISRSVGHGLAPDEAASSEHITVDSDDEFVVEELPEREDVSAYIVFVEYFELTKVCVDISSSGCDQSASVEPRRANSCRST